jgi:lipopolysaccharide transport system permease protein
MQEVLVEAGKSSKTYWKEIWQARELIWLMGKRDLSVRYKQTILGVLWAVIKPISTMVIFIFLFDRIAKFKVEPGLENKAPLIIYTGVLLWTFYASALSQVSISIIGNTNMVSKVYFPRLILPVSAFAVPLSDFLIGVLLLFPIYFYLGFTPNLNLIWVPLLMLLAYLSALGLGLIFAVLNVQYRDFGQIVPFVVQFGYFMFPVAFSTVNLQYSWWYKYYNWLPVVGLIDAFRWATLGGYAPFKPESLIPSIIVTAVLLVVALYLFRKKENTFVDYI